MNRIACALWLKGNFGFCKTLVNAVVSLNIAAKIKIWSEIGLGDMRMVLNTDPIISQQ